MTLAKQSSFTLESLEQSFRGFYFDSPSDKWNGWAIPYFTLEEALKLSEAFNKADNGQYISYNEKDDYFVLFSDGATDVIDPIDIITEEGVVHAYSIGGQSWCWIDEQWKP